MGGRGLANLKRFKLHATIFRMHTVLTMLNMGKFGILIFFGTANLKKPEKNTVTLCVPIEVFAGKVIFFFF